MKAIWLAVLLAIGGIAHPSAAEPAPDELRVGQVIGNELGQVVNGWRQQGGAFYTRRVTEGYVTRETQECCVSTFKRGDVLLFALTEPIARGPQGGVEAARIKKLWKFTPEPGEENVDCNLLWITPIASFSTGPNRVIRSVIFNGAEFIVVRWYAPEHYCDYGD